MKRSITTLAIFAASLFVLSTVSGCATIVDQRVGLTYERLNRSFGAGSGDIVVTRSDSRVNGKNQSGEWILGTLNNSRGVQQARLLSDRVPDEWVTDALLQELKSAGFNAVYKPSLPDGTRYGVNISDINAFLHVTRGAVSDDTKHELKFNVNILVNGSRVKTFTVTSKESRTFAFTVSREEMERIMLQSLQEAIQQIMPEIISLTAKK